MDRWTPIVIALAVCLLSGPGARAAARNPMVISLEIPAPKDSAGGISVADVNDDGKQDFLVTVPGHLAVYDNAGRKLWIEKADLVVGASSEGSGLLGHN